MTETPIRSVFPITIPDHWTPEQVLAVVEFLGNLRQALWTHHADLREAIAALYHEELIEAYRERRRR